MGRKCSVVGCSNSVGLHWFPRDAEIRRQWLRAVGLGENSDLPPQSGVCKQHFARDSYANMTEFGLGYAKKLILKQGAVPTLALPRQTQRPPTLLPRTSADCGRPSEAKGTREVGCQTEPVTTKGACALDSLKHCRQSKAAQDPNQTESCDTGTLMEIPLTGSPRVSSTPLKRKRCEVSFHSDNGMSTVNCTSPTTEVPPYKDKKYIVHEDQLLELFRRCPVCTDRCTVDTMTIGTFLRVTQQCVRCEHCYQWCSQPMVNGIPSGNLQLCAAVLFTGLLFNQISKFLEAFNIQGLSEESFFQHQTKLLIPAVSQLWKLEQDALIRDAIDGGAVTLGGDMQLDPPGHSANYGSFTMMNLRSNKVIDVQLIQSNEGGNSKHMEKEGFVRSLSKLEERGVKVKAIVTDRHAGVQKFLREDKKEMAHYFDPWHMGKEIGKKLDELAKRKGTQDVGLWRKSVVNHLYWAASTSSSGQEALAKWTSVANHIQNVHTHNNTLFPCCLHGPLVGEKARQWLKPSTAACERLTAILLAPQFLKDVEKISPLYHPSTLEAFHSLISRFSPESVAFSFREMFARLQIVALHYNENATQSHITAAEGALSFAAVYLKYKQSDHTVRALKTKPTTFYIDKLMAVLFESVVDDAAHY